MVRYRLNRCPASAGVLLCAAVLGGCGDSHSTASRADFGRLPRDYVPVAIGNGAAYHPPPRTAAVSAGRPVGGLRCRAGSGARFGAHLEVFVRDHVVAIPTGVGLRPPLTINASRVQRARCAYPMQTSDPTGVIEIRRGARVTLGEFFRLWGQPLSRSAVAGFRAGAGQRLVAYLGTRRWRGAPGAIPLRRHTRVVLELRSDIPPHTTYDFPPGL